MATSFKITNNSDYKLQASISKWTDIGTGTWQTIDANGGHDSWNRDTNDDYRGFLMCLYYPSSKNTWTYYIKAGANIICLNESIMDETTVLTPLGTPQ